MNAQHTPTVHSSRRLVFACKADDGFRTSPLVFREGAADVLGLNAASVQLAEHAVLAHDGDTSVGFESVDLPEGD